MEFEEFCLKFTVGEKITSSRWRHDPMSYAELLGVGEKQIFIRDCTGKECMESIEDQTWFHWFPSIVWSLFRYKDPKTNRWKITDQYYQSIEDFKSDFCDIEEFCAVDNSTWVEEQEPK